MMQSFIAVGAGAAVGAWIRWGLGVLLNPIFPSLPLGTLAANLIGGFLMGIALALIGHYQAMSPEVRLLLTAGFLGGLTTFSAFSAETAGLLLRGQYGWTITLVLAHVVGSVALTILGIAAANYFLSAPKI